MHHPELAGVASQRHRVRKVLQVTMLAAPPATATEEPEQVSIRDCHLLPWEDVADGDSYDRQHLPGLDLMEPGSRVAGVIQHSEHSALIQRVNAYVFVPRGSRLQVHAVALVGRRVPTRGPEELHMPEV
jgi:hypothetical protein